LVLLDTNGSNVFTYEPLLTSFSRDMAS
jgi:hypothetical protein